MGYLDQTAKFKSGASDVICVKMQELLLSPEQISPTVGKSTSIDVGGASAASSVWVCSVHTSGTYCEKSDLIYRKWHHVIVAWSVSYGPIVKFYFRLNLAMEKMFLLCTPTLHLYMLSPIISHIKILIPDGLIINCYITSTLPTHINVTYKYKNIYSNLPAPPVNRQSYQSEKTYIEPKIFKSTTILLDHWS